jgi:hypothetical protein
MEDAPAGIPSRFVDHLADLVVGKVVGNPASFCLLMAGLTQQEALQGFIQGGEPFLRCKLGDLAEFLKGEVMAEDRPCYQEVAGRGRQSGQATLDQLAHIRGKYAVRWSGFEDRWLRLKYPTASRDQAGYQAAAFEQHLEQRVQVGRLPVGFCEQPRGETLGAEAASGCLAQRGDPVPGASKRWYC